jgi:hypothetical protein
VGFFVDALLATITEFAASASLVELIATTAAGVLALALAILSIAYLSLKRRYDRAEADLFERSVGTHSRNWTNTAQSLEKKAKEPGEVARSSAMTYLHMLDEAADAWLKGSQWQDALRVTQQFLLECCHTIGKPALTESEFRATADLIELRLNTYADLSKAASEAPENATRFLSDLDNTLSVLDQGPRVAHLRTQIDRVHSTVEAMAIRERKKKPSLAGLRHSA